MPFQETCHFNSFRWQFGGGWNIIIPWFGWLSSSAASAPFINATQYLHPSSKHIWNMRCSLVDMCRLKRPGLRLLKSVSTHISCKITRGIPRYERNRLTQTSPPESSLRRGLLCGLGTSASMLAPSTQATRPSRNRNYIWQIQTREVSIGHRYARFGLA
jgi:hypothetical protein